MWLEAGVNVRKRLMNKAIVVYALGFCQSMDRSACKLAQNIQKHKIIVAVVLETSPLRGISASVMEDFQPMVNNVSLNVPSIKYLKMVNVNAQMDSLTLLMESPVSAIKLFHLMVNSAVTAVENTKSSKIRLVSVKLISY